MFNSRRPISAHRIRILITLCVSIAIKKIANRDTISMTKKKKLKAHVFLTFFNTKSVK